jgi:hypothetical protein
MPKRSIRDRARTCHYVPADVMQHEINITCLSRQYYCPSKACHLSHQALRPNFQFTVNTLETEQGTINHPKKVGHFIRKLTWSLQKSHCHEKAKDRREELP